MRRMLLMSLVLFPSLLGAQTLDQLAPGDRVRVEPHPGRGSIVVVTAVDSAEIRGRTGTREIVVPINSITRLQRSTGTRPRGEGAVGGLMRGALIVGGIGALLGAALGEEDGFITRGEGAALFGLTFGAIGGLVGAVAGGASPGEHWEPVQLPTLNASRADRQ
jgi:hypothetical protein